MNGVELPLSFSCAGATLLGVLHRPGGAPTAGVVVVVGGPQYRVGSHRQFLILARQLADAGVAVLRFDCRGMGDSGGEFPGFEAIGPDIGAAVDALARACPSVRKFMLWGLCDGASAIASYAQGDRRVAGAVLVNPWVRTEASHARAQIKHYYLRRLFDREFLAKLLRGGVNPLASLASLVRTGLQARRAAAEPLSLPERMAAGLERFPGPLLLILSGRDLTAREFSDVAGQSERWRGILAGERVTRRDLPAADHTFSRREWTDQVFEGTIAWMRAELGVG